MKPLAFLSLLSLPLLTTSTPLKPPIRDHDDPLTVKTRTGIYTGAVSDAYPGVREFRGIPFAQPPVGTLRWLPPQPLERSDGHSYATRFAPGCPQYVTWRRSVWNSQIQDFMIRLPPYQSYTSGLMAQSTSEDCLHLAVWTPFDGRGDVDEDEDAEDEKEREEIDEILREDGSDEDEEPEEPEVGEESQVPEEEEESEVPEEEEESEVPEEPEEEEESQLPEDPVSTSIAKRKLQHPKLKFKLKPKPKPLRKKKLLPVVFFVTGGSFQSGGIDIAYQIPAQWVSRTRSHIVVTVNYRTNIFGFPGAAGLSTSQNLGILDQRAALEWVRDNIEAFGGDPDHIIMWGQSAGGVSADVHSYAFHDDIIVKGLFMQSGSAMRKGFWVETPGFTNFSFVARNLGCAFDDGDDPVGELECMRSVPATLIENFVGRYADAAYEDNYETIPILVFRPSPDDKIIWKNFTEQALAGKVANVPALISNTANEQSSMHRYPALNLTAGPNQTAVDIQNVEGFVCVTSNTTANRAINGLTTYRYQYAGNFSNLAPLWWMGAYHSSDTPLLMGTYDLNGNSTRFENRVSRVMQDWVFEFVLDPENGLKRRGWLPMKGAVEEGGMVMRFAVGGRVQQKISSLEIDDSCWGKAKYDHNPGYNDGNATESSDADTDSIADDTDIEGETPDAEEEATEVEEPGEEDADEGDGGDE